jgi:hypothetical protein
MKDEGRFVAIQCSSERVRGWRDSRRGKVRRKESGAERGDFAFLSGL